MSKYKKECYSREHGDLKYTGYGGAMQIVLSGAALMTVTAALF